MGHRVFERLLAPLVAQVGYGHTQIYGGSSWSSDAGVWIELQPISERLVVSAVCAQDQASAIGASVEAIEGIPTSLLARRMGERRGYENVYTNLNHLVEAIHSARGLADLLERPALGDFVTFEVLTPGGRRQTLKVPVAAKKGPARLEAPSRIQLPPRDGAGLAAGFLDEACTIGYFGMGSSMKYREAFEGWRSSGTISNRQLDAVVRDVTGQAATGDTDHRIAQIPAVTERLMTLFSEMKAHKTSLLIIDQRENEGGHSAFAGILEYFLYPLDAILTADEGYQVRRYSALYFQNYTTDSIEQVRGRTSPDLQLGDYDFSSQREWERGRDAVPSAAELAQRRQHFLESETRRSPTFARALAENRWNASWSPRVVVLTSARTYSAGFDAVLTLRAHGAMVVGVPSSQAANCFIDTLSFQLTHSHLYGGLSFKWSVGLPKDLVAGSLLPPDRELTYEQCKAMAFDPNAAVLLAMEAPAGKTAPPKRK